MTGLSTDEHFACFPELIQAHGENQPDLPALREGSAMGSWAELARTSARIANRLLDLGCGRGARIALLGRNSIAYSEAMAGVISSGAAFVPLPFMTTADNLRRMLDDCRPSVLMLDQECLPLVEEFIGDLDYLDTDGLIAFDFEGHGFVPLKTWASSASDEDPAVQIEPKDTFNIIYSSGTTGVPKGIVLNHETRLNQVHSMVGMGFGDATINLVATPLYSLGALSMWMPTIAAGGCNILMGKFSARDFLEIVEAEKVSHVILVPEQYRRILAEPDYDMFDLHSLRLKVGGSAPSTIALKQDIAARMPGEMLEFYSLTEGGVTTALFVNHEPEKLGSVGAAVNGCVIKIIDEEGMELPTGEVGEIVGRSRLKMDGYLNREQENRDIIWCDGNGDDFIRSGDNGYLDEDGYLYLKDRKKDMIISGGMNVYAADIEGVLHCHDAIERVAVIGILSEQWGESAFACLVLKDNANLSWFELERWSNERLTKAQRLAGMRVFKGLPENHLGKVLKTDLRKIIGKAG